MLRPRCCNFLMERQGDLWRCLECGKSLNLDLTEAPAPAVVPDEAALNPPASWPYPEKVKAKPKSKKDS